MLEKLLPLWLRCLQLLEEPTIWKILCRRDKDKATAVPTSAAIYIGTLPSPWVIPGNEAEKRNVSGMKEEKKISENRKEVKIWSDPIPAFSRLPPLLEQTSLARWARWSCFCDESFFFSLNLDARYALYECDLTDQ